MNKFVFVVLISLLVPSFLQRQRYKGLALVGHRKTIRFGGWLVPYNLKFSSGVWLKAHIVRDDL